MKLTSEDIQKYYSKLSHQQKVYKENKEYVKGDNPEILRQARKKDPDNRLPIPLAKSAVIDMTGYAGSNITINYETVSSDEKDTRLDEYRDLMREFQDYNDDDIITTQLYRESISHVKTFLIMWTSDTLNLPNGMMTPEYTVVGMDKVVPVYNNSLKPVLEAACYFDKQDDTIECDVYYPLIAEHWESKDGNDWKRLKLKDKKYPYRKTPVIPFEMGVDGGPLFQAEKRLIDKHDSVISKAQNEMDRFNALVTLFPFTITPEFMQKFEEMKGLDDLDQYEKWPQYLEKNLQGVTEYTNMHIDRLERLFHKCIKVVDFNQIVTQGGDESGSARAFKLIGMEFMAASIEKVFIKGFYERAELLNDIILASTSKLKKDIDAFTTSVTARRNLPVDEKSKVEIAEALKRLGVRNETVLKMLPETLIKDPEKEAEAMEKKQLEDAKKFNDMLGGRDDEEGNSNS